MPVRRDRAAEDCRQVVQRRDDGSLLLLPLHEVRCSSHDDEE